MHSPQHTRRQDPKTTLNPHSCCWWRVPRRPAATGGAPLAATHTSTAHSCSSSSGSNVLSGDWRPHRTLLQRTSATRLPTGTATKCSSGHPGAMSAGQLVLGLFAEQRACAWRWLKRKHVLLLHARAPSACCCSCCCWPVCKGTTHPLHWLCPTRDHTQHQRVSSCPAHHQHIHRVGVRSSAPSTVSRL
jgi:hypothetical protein